jgi:3-methyladenine DNA glycosylase Mpg
MDIDKRLNGHDLLSNDFFIAAPTRTEVFKTVKGPRIGVDYAKHWARRHLRFYIKGNPSVSRLKGKYKKRDLLPDPAVALNIRLLDYWKFGFLKDSV